MQARTIERRERILDKLALAHGAARRARLCDGQADERAMRRMIADGALVGHPQRVVALPGADWRVVVARRLGGVITCDHALAQRGLPLQDRPGRRLHVVKPDDPAGAVIGAGRVTVHQVAGSYVDPLGDPFADPESALVSYLRCSPELDALIAVEAALRGGLVVRDQLLARLPGARNGRLRAVVLRADPRGRSILETIARYELESAGIAPEVAVPTAAGELDLLLEGRLNIETDGYEFHSDQAAWTRDRYRDQWLAAHGITPLRLTARQVLAHETVHLVEPVARRLGCWHPTV